MRHHNTNRKLGRVRRQRHALIQGLMRSLILKGKMVTSEAKAKEVRPAIEKLITKSKTNTLATRRLISSRLGNDPSVTARLFTLTEEKYKDRAGGYTRITKLGKRQGDASERALIEFV